MANATASFQGEYATIDFWKGDYLFEILETLYYKLSSK